MIKIAVKKDIDEISKLRVLQQKDDWNELYYGDDNKLYNLTFKYLEEHLNNDLIIFTEQLDNKIVATCGLQIIKYLPQCNDNGIEGYICNVFTLKEHRKKGIQTNLLKECIEYAKSNNIFELQLSTDNLEAIKIYKNLGFKFDNMIMKKEM